MGGHRKGLDQLDAEGGEGVAPGILDAFRAGAGQGGAGVGQAEPRCIARSIEARNSPLPRGSVRTKS